MDDSGEFNVLLYELSLQISDDEIDGIVWIEDLPRSLVGREKLEVLNHLLLIGRISESDPSTLQEIFMGINRMDLVGKVKQFIKSQKKKGKMQKSGKERYKQSKHTGGHDGSPQPTDTSMTEATASASGSAGTSGKCVYWSITFLH